MLAASSSWNESSLLTIYQQGLSPRVGSRWPTMITPGDPSNCPLAPSPKPLVLRSGIHCLDCPGMPLVNPHIVRWETSKILRWSETCHKHCITNLPIPWTLTTPIQVKSTLVESLEPEMKPEIPSDYLLFQDIFSKQAATKLPPPSAMGQHDRPAAWCYTPQGSCLSTVHPGAQSHGELHPGGFQTGVHPIFPLPSGIELLLRG